MDPFQSVAHGVGHAPPTVPPMGSAGVGSGHNSPARIHPHGGNVGEDSIEAERNDVWAILQEEVLGSKDPSDANDLGPQAAALVSEAEAGADAANALARPARAQEIHSAGVGRGIPFAHVAFVDGESGEPSFGGALSEDGAAEGIDLDRRDRFVTEDEAGKEATSDACADVDGSHLAAFFGGFTDAGSRSTDPRHPRRDRGPTGRAAPSQRTTA